MKKQQDNTTKKREFYWLTLILMPTILMSITSNIVEPLVRILSQLLIFFFQAVIVKGLIENTH